MESKERLRRTIGAALAAMTEDQRRTQSAELVRSLWDEASALGFEVVLGTLPLEEEPDLLPFFLQWLADGRRVALARTGPGRTLGFHYIANLEGPWDHRPFGLREPPQASPVWSPGPPTLCLVPGLAFALEADGGCWRLGRGAGYYDRWLGEYSGHLTSWGVGYALQRVEAVPIEPHDKKLDGLLLSGKR